MPYPSKTTASSILATAIAHLETTGQDGLSLRALAGALGITPRALYRYFPDRAALEAAIAAESYRELLDAMRRATDSQPPAAAVTAAAAAYLTFAETHPARYGMMISASHEPGMKSQAQEAVWEFVLESLARITGQPESEAAALSLWALLHGFAELEQAGIPSGKAHIERGLAIFLAGLAAAEES